MSYIKYEVRVYDNGTKEWFLNDKLHREDGPAVEGVDGSKSWFLNGKCHREDGPAVEWVDGYKAWFLNGKCCTEEEFNVKMNIKDCEDKVVEVDGVEYVLKKTTND